MTPVIVGAMTRANIEENAAASDVAPLTDHERALVNVVAARITVPHSES